jgi:diaminopimelate epimerase
MMRKIEFYKLQASGNDFILINNHHSLLTTHQLREFTKRFCQRKLGIGADGLLVVEPSKIADFKMRIFNPDGTEVEMCGNGARCVALWASHKLQVTGHRPPVTSYQFKLETKAGVIESQLTSQKSEIKNWGEVRMKMVAPFDLKLDLPIKIFGRRIKVNFINTGVPHTVIFVEGLEKINVGHVGRVIRFHRKFKPAGTNVDFVEVLDDNLIKLRTYERGVEAETLACGTGVVASAIVSSYKSQVSSLKSQVKSCKFRVLTKSGEILKVYLAKKNNGIENVWLEGRAYLVYKGEIDLEA